MLIVIAQEEELKLVKELGYDGYPVIITGVGAINVIKALKDLPKDIEILNIGYCGSNAYKIGDRLIVGVVATYHANANFAEKELNLYLASNDKVNDVTRCYTSTDFVTKIKTKEPCVFDMELAFIRAMFYNTRAIKVVSDNLSKKQYKENIK